MIQKNTEIKTEDTAQKYINKKYGIILYKYFRN